MRKMLAALAVFAYFLALLPGGSVLAAAEQQPAAETVSVGAVHAETRQSIIETIAKCCMKDNARSDTAVCKIDCTATLPIYISDHADTQFAFGMPTREPVPQTSPVMFFRPPIAT